LIASPEAMILGARPSPFSSFPFEKQPMIFRLGQMFFQHLTYNLEYPGQIVIGHPFQDYLHQIVIRKFLQVYLHRIFIGLSVKTKPQETVKVFYETMGVFCHKYALFPFSYLIPMHCKMEIAILQAPY
jgi:hypothetical protein